MNTESIIVDLARLYAIYNVRERMFLTERELDRQTKVEENMKTIISNPLLKLSIVSANNEAMLNGYFVKTRGYVPYRKSEAMLLGRISDIKPDFKMSFLDKSIFMAKFVMFSENWKQLRSDEDIADETKASK